MNKLLTVSKYKNNLIAKKSRVFLSSLLDYFILVVLTFIVFTVAGTPIMTSLPVFNNAISEINEKTSDLYSIVSETRLQTFDESSKQLGNVETDAINYLKTLMKTSLYVYGKTLPVYNQDTNEYIQENVKIEYTFLNTNNNEYPNDNLSYYCFNFKTQHEELNSFIYEDVDYSNNKDVYLYEKVLGFENETISAYFVNDETFASFSDEIKEKLTKYNVLTEKNLDNIIAILVYGENNGTINIIYDNLINSYKLGVQFFIDDVEQNYAPYIEKTKEFNLAFNSYVMCYIVNLVLCYVFAFFILQVILPLLLKENCTIAQRSMKLRLCNLDEGEPLAFNIVIRNIVLFFIYFSGIFFSLFFSNLMQISVFPINNSSLNLLEFIVFSLLLSILSGVFLLINKNNQQLDLFSSFLVVKDIEKFENIGGEITENVSEVKN